MTTNLISIHSSTPIPLLPLLELGNAGFWALLLCFHLSSCWLPTGDIAFRFLNYIQAQHQRKQKRQLRAQQNLSWEEIARKYQNEEDSLGSSHVVVCDINKEMLKIGKQKASAQGYKTGKSYREHTEECLHVYKIR